MLPRVLQGERIGLLARLVANAMLQVTVAVTVGLYASRLLGDLPGSRGRLPELALLLLAVAALLYGLRWLERVDAQRLAQSYVFDLRMKMFGRLWHADPRAALRRGRGAMILRLMGDMGAIGRWIGLGLARLVSASTVMIGALAALAWFVPTLAALALALVTVLVLHAFLSRAALDTAVGATRAARGRLATRANDALHALMSLQASGAWLREQRRVRRSGADVRDAAIAEQRRSSALLAGSEVVALLAPTLALLTLAAVAAESYLPLALVLFGLLISPMRDLTRVFDLWRKAAVARAKTETILRLPRLRRARDGGQPVGSVGTLAFEGAAVRGVLAPVELFAAAGDRVQLVSRTPAEASVLLQLAVRLFDPDAGRVLVDEQDVRTLDIVGLRSRIALVNPAFGLQRGSLRRALTLRRPEASEADVEQLIDRCRLGPMLEALPEGLATHLQESGSNLPRAVRGRIALAQALLAEPDVLLLDDVDAWMPAQQAHELRAILATFQGTVVLASPDPQWRGWANRVWSAGTLAAVRTRASKENPS